MNGPVSRTRRAALCQAARRARFASRHYQLGRLRRKAGPVHDAQRARQRRLSRAAGLKGSLLCPGHGQVSCMLPSHICVAICRNKSVPCTGGLRRECVAGASWSAELEEARHDG